MERGELVHSTFMVSLSPINSNPEINLLSFID